MRRSSTAQAPRTDAQAFRSKIAPTKVISKRKDDVIEEAETEGESSAEDSSGQEGGSKGADKDSDSDAPRVSQWIDEDELEESDGSFEHEEKQDGSGGDLNHLRNDLSSLPFGALARARQTLSRDVADVDSADDSDGSASVPSLNSKGKGKAVEGNAPKRLWGQTKAVEKRAHKHAPMEITSKRPVTRRRTVVEVSKVKTRDPRFSDLSGEFQPDLFNASYGFLPELQKSEVTTLRTALKAARKALSSSPRHLLEEREEEVARLERALKRVESNVQRIEREKRERRVLTEAAKEERQKRAEGKKGWWMKESDKRVLLTKARFEELEATGGRQAVKKVVEKRKKKVAQKEKKSRPFAAGQGGPSRASEHDSKRRRVG